MVISLSAPSGILVDSRWVSSSDGHRMSLFSSDVSLLCIGVVSYSDGILSGVIPRVKHGSEIGDGHSSLFLLDRIIHLMFFGWLVTLVGGSLLSWGGDNNLQFFLRSKEDCSS